MIEEMSIHKTIRDGRKRLGMTEQQFANALGVTRGAVQQWEKDDGTAPKRKLQPEVAKLLGITVGELLAESPTLSAQLPSGEWTPHVNPSLHHASSGASAPATLQNALEFLAGYLSALDAGDRARAVRDIADLADEPQAVAKITARIEAMASPAFTDKKRSNG